MEYLGHKEIDYYISVIAGDFIRSINESASIISRRYFPQVIFRYKRICANALFFY